MYRSLLLALLCLCSKSYAFQTPEKIPSDNKVKTGKLANGFTYYIRKNTTPEKRVVLYLVNKVGSILETEQQQGLAHFLEHMAFNGTRNFPENSLVNYLEKSGVRFGADLNAYTGFDETVYQLPIASDNKQILENAFLIMRDWAGAISLDSVEIDKERGVIMAEKRQRESPSQLIQLALMPMKLNHSRYADRMPIGTEQVLLGFKHEEIRKFYQTWYRPDLQALIVVGDIDVAQTELLIRKLFAELKNPSTPVPRKQYNIPLTNKNQFRSVVDPLYGNTTVELTIKLPGLPLATTADYRKTVLRSLASLMAAGRFSELTQKPDAPFLSASFSIQKAIANLDAFNSTVSVKPGGLERGVKAWYTELERIRQYGFTGEELKRASTQYLTQIERAYTEREKTPSDSYVKEYVQLFTSNIASPGIAYEFELVKKILSTVKASDVHQIVRESFTANNRDLIVQSNEKNKDELPTESTLTKWMNTVAAAPIAAYSDPKAGTTTLLSKLPVPGTISSESFDKENEITTMVFSNGVKLLLKPTTFSTDQIFLNASSAGGLSLLSDADFYNGTLAAQLVGASGIGDMSAEDLRKWMTGKSVMVSPYISELGEGFSGGSSVKDLETALQMIYLYFTNPRKDDQVFKRFIEQAKLGYANAAQQSSTALQDTLASIFGNHHFRKLKMPVELFDKLNASKALEIFRERFRDASDFTFILVGSFNIDTIKPLLLQYLGGLPTDGKKEQYRDLGFRIPTEMISRRLVKGTDQKANVSLFFTGSFNYNADTAAQMRAVAAILQSRLMERLREKEGGVYTVQATAGIQKDPVGEYNFTIRFVCDPGNADHLIESVKQEIAALKKDGAGMDAVEKFKAVELKSLGKAVKENRFWTQFISGSLMHNEPIDVQQLQHRITSVTPETVKDVANRYINPASIISVVLVPETK